MLHNGLSHPNILPLQGIMQGSNKEEYFMVLPFVEYDLDHVMNASRFNSAQVNPFQEIVMVLLLTVYISHL